jgi:ssDNA-binding Zn-finger/Zn-ribbon topoisomerase 1
MNSEQKRKLTSIIGQKTTKSCPDCGAVMIVRMNRQDGTFFLGCHRYPDCKVTMEIDEAFMMKLQGYKEFWEAK